MKKIILLTAVLIAVLFALSGCGANKYNAVMYSHAEESLTESFLRENRVKAYYDKDGYVDDGQGDLSDSIMYDKDSPVSRTVIVAGQSMYEEIFVTAPADVNFETETVILYFFPDMYPKRNYKLKKIKLNDGTLTVHFGAEANGKKDAVMPYQRCLMVRLDKTDFNEVNFIEQI